MKLARSRSRGVGVEKAERGAAVWWCGLIALLVARAVALGARFVETEIPDEYAEAAAKARDALRAALMDVQHTLAWLETQLMLWSREAEKRNTEREKELSVARNIQQGLLPRAA